MMSNVYFTLILAAVLFVYSILFVDTYFNVKLYLYISFVLECFDVTDVKRPHTNENLVCL